MDCDDCLKCLIEEQGGKTPERRKEFEEHLASCEDCKTLPEAYGAYEEEMAKPTRPVPEDDSVRKAVMAYAETHIAMKNRKPAAIKTPRRVWFQALAMAACLVVGVGLGFLGRGEQHPDPYRETLGSNPIEARLVLADLAFRLGLVEDAHDLAKKVLATSSASVGQRERAEEILKKK